MSNPVLKSLIESMIVNHLEESYEDDLVESIFDEVSEETWEAIEEAILNELSPKTLASYTKKASKDIGYIQRDISDKEPGYKSLYKKRDNRIDGVSRAVDRMTKNKT